MLRTSLQGGPHINNLAQLLFAEEVLDHMEAESDHSAQYHLLKAKAQAYVRANPELIATPWLRIGGAVFDIIELVRGEAAVNFV